MKIFNIFKKKEKNNNNSKEVELQKPKVEEKIEEKPKYHHMKFSVAGVTFKNGRKSRQTILRKIKFRDEPFEKVKSFEFELYEFEGEQAYKILVNGECIGNIPKKEIAEFEKYKYKPLTLTSLEITGGGKEYSYGCEIIIRFDLD